MAGEGEAAMGARVRTLRLQRRWTQAELGAMIGERQPLISRWEKGKLSPGSAQAVRVAAALGVTVEWLYTGEAGLDPVFRQMRAVAEAALSGGDPALAYKLAGRSGTLGTPTQWAAVVRLLADFEEKRHGRRWDDLSGAEQQAFLDVVVLLLQDAAGLFPEGER